MPREYMEGITRHLCHFKCVLITVPSLSSAHLRVVNRHSIRVGTVPDLAVFRNQQGNNGSVEICDIRFQRQLMFLPLLYSQYAPFKNRPTGHN